MAVSDRELIDFVYAEARMLDELRFEDWLDLYTEDGHYWMPLAHGQTDAKLHASLMYEDKLLLRVRVERLAGQRTFSQQPRAAATICCRRRPSSTAIPNPRRPKAYVVRTAFHYVETRQDAQTLYAGWATHHLVEQDGALRIRLKRVDLVNCDAAFGNINCSCRSRS